MTIEREVTIAGQMYPVILSDENEALQAAKAAGRAIVGLWRENKEENVDSLTLSNAGQEETENGKNGKKEQADYSSCLYLITDPEDADEEFLERVVRRHLDLPWVITGSERLIIREFAPEDPLEPASSEDAEGTFSDWNKREEYRKHQYRFAECGLWALERRVDGVLVGKAGLTDGELGYHIYAPFRRQGYALEACQAILKYGFETLELQKIQLSVKRSNTASWMLAKKMGFSEQDTGKEENAVLCLYRNAFSLRKDSIVFCMQKGYNSLYTK